VEHDFFCDPARVKEALEKVLRTENPSGDKSPQSKGTAKLELTRTAAGWFYGFHELSVKTSLKRNP
jgi:hypothetical protein